MPAVVALTIAAVYLLQAQVHWEWRRLRERDESWELVQEIARVAATPGVHVVLDIDVSDYTLLGEPRLRPRTFPAPEDVSQLTIGGPARLWVVRRLREKTQFVLDRDFDAERFDSVQVRFSPRRVWVSTSGAYELYVADLRP